MSEDHPDRRAAVPMVPLLEAARLFADAAAAEFNEKGAGGYALARLSDLRDAIRRFDDK